MRTRKKPATAIFGFQSNLLLRLCVTVFLGTQISKRHLGSQQKHTFEIGEKAKE